jgi:tryptophan synthase alpha chain
VLNLQTVNNTMFIPFIVAGDPHPDATIELALALQESGAAVLELGIPYSDPLADGPVIQRAAQRALTNGMTLQKAVQLVATMRKKGLKIPIIIFTYYNPVLQLGEEYFFALARKNGVDGVLIPDLPFEESAHVRQLSWQYGLSFISLVAPTSKQRIRNIASSAKGFLYCISALGVTGKRDKLPDDLYEFLAEVKQYSKVPIAVGFGISTSKQVQLLKDHCDGIVIGSALVEKIEHLKERLVQEETRKEALQEFTAYVQSLIKPLGNDKMR